MKQINRLSLLNALAGLLFFLAFILLLGIASYYKPREVVYVTQPVLLTKDGVVGEKTYKAGEIIEGYFETENYVDSIATFKRNIVCGGEQVRLVYSFGEVQNFPIAKTPREVRRSVIGVIPDELEAKKCFIEIIALYEVNVFPLITRTYSYRIVTNNFIVE